MQLIALHASASSHPEFGFQSARHRAHHHHGSASYPRYRSDFGVKDCLARRASSFDECLAVSYLAIRQEPDGQRAEGWADKVFLAGLIALVTAVSFLAVFRI